MSTGTVLRVRAGMKPIATVPHALRTVDVATGDTAAAHHQRSDVCAVPAAGVVAEAMVAIVLAEVVLEKFGGDSVGETRRNLESYLAAIPETLRTADGQRRRARRGMTSRSDARSCSSARWAPARRASAGASPRRSGVRSSTPTSRSSASTAPSPQLFRAHGEAHFRALERAAVREGLATRRGRRRSAAERCCDADTRADLAAHGVVLLTVEPRVVAARLRDTTAPAAAGRGPDRAVDADLASERAPLYAGAGRRHLRHLERAAAATSSTPSSRGRAREATDKRRHE